MTSLKQLGKHYSMEKLPPHHKNTLIVYQTDDWGRAAITVNGIESYKLSEEELAQIIQKCVSNITPSDFHEFMQWYCQTHYIAYERLIQKDCSYIHKYCALLSNQ